MVRMNKESGAIQIAGAAVERSNPSFLALNEKGTHLYAVSESLATAYKINKATGALTKLNSLPVADAKGQGACHLCVVPGANMLVTANYSGGSVTTFSIAADGSLARRTGFIQHRGSSTNLDRQEAPHAHGAIVSPDEKHVLVNDLGTDRVYIYRVDAAATTLVPKPAGEGVLTPGAGPRHSAFDASGRFVFCLNELDLTVTPFRWQPDAQLLVPLKTVSTLPEGTETKDKGFSTAEIVVHPNGNFVYGSNRKHDTIAVFAHKDGALTLLENEPSGGKTPRNFNLTPDGNFLLSANQDSGDLAVFSIGVDGMLTPTKHTANVAGAECVIFLPE